MFGDKEELDELLNELEKRGRDTWVYSAFVEMNTILGLEYWDLTTVII